MRDSAVCETGLERGANTEETESPRCSTKNDQEPGEIESKHVVEANLFFSRDDANAESEKDKEIERIRSIVRFTLSDTSDDHRDDRLGRLI